MWIYFGIAIAVALIIFFYYNSRGDADRLKKVKEASLDLTIVKIALWIDLDMVDGQKYEYPLSYYTKVKSAMTGANTDVLVALFKAGSYDFVVSSTSRKKYKNIKMRAELMPGETYQLGCDEDGPYLTLDPDPARYNLKS